MKEQILQHIGRAKTAHINWRVYAEAVVAGLPVENEVPVMSRACDFGKWYYGEGRQFAFLKPYIDIENYHEIAHKKFAQICDILFAPEHTYTMRNGRRYFDKARLVEARKALQELIAASDQILKRMDLLEREAKQAMPDESEFEEALEI